MPAAEMKLIQTQEEKSALLCCSGDAVNLNIQGRAAKLASANKIFYNNLTLAASMAVWVTLFGLPVYSSYANWLTFGNKDRCGPNKMGLKANVGTEEHPILVNMNATLVKEGYEPYAWCGFFPGAYAAAWPAVVQTMIFTVYASTGNTARQAWQGLAGTFIACCNIWIMESLYSNEHSHTGGATAHGYRGWIGWANITFVLFMFLVTKAQTNTMMYGMSWTISFMLHYMNPDTGSRMGTYHTALPAINWDAETTVALLTAFAGCGLAVVATIIPRPLLSIRNVHREADEIIVGINEILTKSIDYWQTSSSGPMRFAVYSKMGELQKATERLSTNLTDAYWETFDLCGYGKIRKLYMMLAKAISENADEVYMLKAATNSIDFEGSGAEMHKKLVQELTEPLREVADAAVQCLAQGAKACHDGNITPAEREEIEAAIKRVGVAQQTMCSRFQAAMKDDEKVSEKNAADQLFIFSVSQWAQECADFAKELSEFEGEYLKQNFGNPFVNFLVMIGREFISTFELKAALNWDQLRYVALNLLPILLTLFITTHATGSVFQPYSGIMPGTLAFMVSSSHGIPFMKNAQKLVGIVFGHTMPLLAMSVITLLDCDSKFRFVLHMSSILAYFFSFTFMYYASSQWSGLGCAIAGFGVYALFSPCQSGFHAGYADHYKAIAQVIIAMVLKIVFQNAFMKSEPRDDALQVLGEVSETIEKAFAAFFDGDIHDLGDKPGLKTLRDKLKDLLGKLEGLAPAADPALAIVPGSRLPFKKGLLDVALNQFRLILSDLDMLVLSMVGHEEGHFKEVVGARVSVAERQHDMEEQAKASKQESYLHSLMKGQPSFQKVRADVLDTVKVVLKLLGEIMAHDTEEQHSDETVAQLSKMSKLSKLDDLDAYCKEVSEVLEEEIKKRSDDVSWTNNRVITDLRRTRLTVALHALALTCLHTSEICGYCFEHMG